MELWVVLITALLVAGTWGLLELATRLRGPR